MAEPEENPVEETRPEWLPDKFESPEALARSYAEAERRLTELSSQNRAMEENFTMLSSQLEEIQQGQQAQPDPADANAQLYAMYENDPIGTQALLAQQAAENAVKAAFDRQQAQTAPQIQAQQALVAQYATMELQRRYPDFDTERERIAEVIDKNPRFNNQNLWDNPATATQALDDAYRLVKADDLLTGKLPASQPGYDADAAKQQAQTATGGNPRPPTPDEQAQAWEAIKNAGQTSYEQFRSR